MRTRLLGIALLTLSLGAKAETFSEGDLNFEITGETTCRLIASPEVSGILSLPPTVVYENKEYSVTSVAAEAFTGAQKLEALLLPGSVTDIGKAVARRCSALRVVEFGESLNTLGDEAFAECGALEAVVLPDGLKAVSRRCFYGDKALREVRLGALTERIESQAFSGCTNLERVVCMAAVPPSVAPYAFSAEAIGKAALIVPVGARQAYASEEIWNSFGNITESDYGGEQIELTLIFPDGRVATQEPVGSRATFEVDATDGWEIAGLYFNGADVTDEITSSGYYTTPELKESSSLSLTLRSLSKIDDVTLRTVVARRVSGAILTDGVPDYTPVRVYSPDGRLLYSGTGSGTIAITAESPVILVAGDNVFKL